MFGISLLPLGSERLAVDRQGCAEVLPAHGILALDSPGHSLNLWQYSKR